MASPQSDRELLFAVIALQLDILDKSRFTEACAVWALDMDRPMADLLQERGWVTAEDRHEITRNLERKLKKHQGDAHASLAEVADSSVREVLRTIEQPPMGNSLARGLLLAGLIPAGGESLSASRYTLSRVHGEGGLGRVWLARDTDLNRKVALKEVRLERSADTRHLRRFLKEAQVTGQLEHPNIVPVHELGRKDDGQPFYTMRFVEGRTLSREIADFHKEAAGRPADRLALRRRLLEPFVKVCEAIGYAHSRQVIHRDLKPENVVLGDHGEVIVLDWGLAKVLPESDDPMATAADDAIALSPDAEADKTQGRMGTPAYMAPEQVAMEDDRIGTRTDLYGLGAILFEILADRPPAQGATLEEVFQNVAAGRVPRAREVAPSVPRPLDAICAKALSLNPEDRYPSAEALADDVRRWMADEPVSVYRDPLTVRLTRWGRRHRTLVTAAAAALLVAAVSAGVVASQQAAHAGAIGRKNVALTEANTALDLQRKKAEERERTAIDAVNRFGDAVSKNAALKKNPSLQPLRQELMKEPLAFFKSLRDQLQADHDTRPESLSRLAEASFGLGKLTNQIGDKQDALIAYRESLATWRRLADDNPAVTEFRDRLATSHNNIGMLLRETGKPAEALKSHESALAIRRKLVEDNPAVAKFRSGLADSHHHIGFLLSETGKPAEALKSHESALAIRRKLAEDNPTVTDFQRRLADIHINFGLVLRETGKPAEAMKSFESAVAIYRRLADDNPAVAEFRNSLAAGHNNIGLVLIETGKPAEALKWFESAVAINQKLADDNPTVTEFRSGLATGYINFGLLLREAGKPAEALKSLQSGVAIYRKLADDNPAVTEFQSRLAEGQTSLGLVLNAANKPAEAMKSHESALAIRRKLAREHPESPDLASSLGAVLNNIAMVDLDAKRFGEARVRLREAVEWQRKALASNPAHPIYRKFLANHLDELIRAARGLGDAEGEAEAQRDRAKLEASDPAIVALDARLAGVIKGGQTPKDDPDRLALAKRAYDVGRHAAAARLFAEALEHDPKLADDRQAQHRYTAARAAALAGSGKGKDDPKPDEAARAKLRTQARDWLVAELAAWSGLLESAKPEQRGAIAKTLRDWQEDIDLAVVRESKAIDALPESERDGWRVLWKDVASVLAHAHGGNP